MATRPRNVPTKAKAVDKLRPSRLNLSQMELMGDDVDVDMFYATLGKAGVNIVEALQTCEVERTIDGASSVKATIIDQNRALLRSGKLVKGLTTEIDGLYFRLVAVNKSGKILNLTFEDREVNVLRQYDKPIKASKATSRSKITRAEFALRLIKEPKELKIRWVIPELHKKQPIEGQNDQKSKTSKDVDRSLGIPKKNDLKVKQSNMAENQRVVANKILDAGASMLLPRKNLVMGIMCAIQESTLANLRMGRPGDYNYLSGDPLYNPVGAMQQIPRWWASRGGASRDVSKDAHAFFEALSSYLSSHKNASYSDAIEGVQQSGNASAYSKWRTEAERIVTEYGITPTTSRSANSQWTPGSSAAGDYEFYRGVPNPYPTDKKTGGGKAKKQKGEWGKEDSWTCLQRLAEEVQWRCFCVSGVIYFISEDDLFKSRPIATISEDSPGIQTIDGDYDEGKKTAQLTVVCRMGRWQAPPGSVVKVEKMGPWNGRWLVSSVRRSLFSSTGTIILKKPMPRLPEPSASNVPGGTTWNGTAPVEDVAQRGQKYRVGTSLVKPIPRGQLTSQGGVHPTEGLTSNGEQWWACDFFANPGSDVVAVESGTITRWSGHNPLLGAIEGAGGPLGWSIYLQGESGTFYYYTHLATRKAAVGQKVSVGQVIATVANYDLFGRASHVHLGVGPGGTFTIQDVMAAKEAVKA